MEDQLVQILENSLLNKPLWAVLIAFAGGIVSSISPCVLSILPIIIGYIGGYSDDKVSKAFLQSLLFVLGFTITLTVVGLIAALAGKVAGSFLDQYWYAALAVITIVMGLSLLEVFYIPFPTFIKEMPTKDYGKILSPIILGLTFGLVATPCSTPVLLVLLGYVAYEGSLIFGIILLVAYALGHSIILLACGTFTGVLKKIGNFRQWTSYITKFSGILLILMGIYLILFGFHII